MTLPQAQTLRTQGAQLRVFVDGHDVTSYCYTADSSQGWALLAVATFQRGANGLDRLNRTKVHQGRVVCDAMIVLGEVQFGYDLAVTEVVK